MRFRRTLQRAGPHLSHGGLLVLLALMVLSRAFLADLRMRPLAPCEGCVARLALQHDAGLVGLALMSYTLSRWIRTPLFQVSVRVLLCLLVSIYALDLLVFFLFNMRLVVEDFLKYGREVGGIITFADRMVESPPGLVLILVLVTMAASMVAFIPPKPRISAQEGRALLVTGLVVLGLSWIPSGGDAALAWAYRSVFGLNLERTIHASYSQEFAAALNSSHDDLRFRGDCVSRPVHRPDMVLVVLEGFSSYHSRYFSGLQDLTPNLDRIASNHTAFERFWANGFTTENGLIALLGGEVPVPGAGQVVFGGGSAFDGFGDLPRSLPRVAAAHGYHTAFLTTGDLAFSGKGAWLRSLGFHEVWGHDDPFYRGWPRFHFKAAPDSALYLRALDWLLAPPPGRPFLLVIETVSSHSPFIDPVTGERSEQAVVQYADRQLGRFYDELAGDGDLDSLLLIVASDHRTMTPLGEPEVSRFGEEARALVPLVVSDPAQPGPRRIVDRFQQVDLALSIEAMLTGTSCSGWVRGDFLKPIPVPPGCVIHARADDRDLIQVRCGEQVASIRLKGDGTHVENGTIPGAQRIIAQINAERLERQRARGRREIKR